MSVSREFCDTQEVKDALQLAEVRGGGREGGGRSHMKETELLVI